MNAGILFDADNTLWDTNAVFLDAQRAMLRMLADHGVLDDPERALPTLRAIDMALVDHVGRFEYDVRQLARAVIAHFETGLQGDALMEALARSPSPTPRTDALARAASRAFGDGLRQLPAILPDTIEILRRLHAARQLGAPLVTAVLSEGDPERLERVFRAYHVDVGALFDEIIVAYKSREAFERARAALVDLLPPSADRAETLFMIVGDALTRDVKFGKQVGFVTVYKPSPFKGIEEPRAADEVADFTIERLGELPAILERLGIPLPTAADSLAHRPPRVEDRPIVIKRLDL